jgi:hypothetical protein
MTEGTPYPTCPACTHTAHGLPCAVWRPTWGIYGVRHDACGCEVIA